MPFLKNLKLSVHSGSDKFSLYQPIRRSLAKFKAGLHLKTAGTTWLEELIGLAEAGKTLAAAGCDVFFVALPEEGIRLRRALPAATICAAVSRISHWAL